MSAPPDLVLKRSLAVQAYTDGFHAGTDEKRARKRHTMDPLTHPYWIAGYAAGRLAAGHYRAMVVAELAKETDANALLADRKVAERVCERLQADDPIEASKRAHVERERLAELTGRAVELRAVVSDVNPEGAPVHGSRKRWCTRVEAMAADGVTITGLPIEDTPLATARDGARLRVIITKE